jgi:hypothetical protein
MILGIYTAFKVKMDGVGGNGTENTTIGHDCMNG